MNTIVNIEEAKDAIRKSLSGAEWVVFNMHSNNYIFNVFHSVTFCSGVVSSFLVALKDHTSYETFKRELKSAAMYSFWSKAEYELIIKSWVGTEREKKIDIFTQLYLNWEAFCRYTWVYILSHIEEDVFIKEKEKD